MDEGKVREKENKKGKAAVVRSDEIYTEGERLGGAEGERKRQIVSAEEGEENGKGGIHAGNCLLSFFPLSCLHPAGLAEKK
jgi:hypothetical protein